MARCFTATRGGLSARLSSKRVLGAGYLASASNCPCAEWLRNRLAQPGLADLTARELAAEAGCQLAEAEAVLERAVTAGLLTRRLAITCPCCDEELAEEDLANTPDVCPHCNRAFRDCGAGVERRFHYLREAESGRSVPWVLVLHGMNTRGRWQEELSWLVATTYGRSCRSSSTSTAASSAACSSAGVAAH
jgi:hypothetical protein